MKVLSTPNYWEPLRTPSRSYRKRAVTILQPFHYLCFFTFIEENLYTLQSICMDWFIDVNPQFFCLCSTDRITIIYLFPGCQYKIRHTKDILPSTLWIPRTMQEFYIKLVELFHTISIQGYGSIFFKIDINPHEVHHRQHIIS